MAKDKRSFFERLTGTVRMKDEEERETEGAPARRDSAPVRGKDISAWIEKETEEEGELPYIRFDPDAQELLDERTSSLHARTRRSELERAPARLGSLRRNTRSCAAIPWQCRGIAFSRNPKRKSARSDTVPAIDNSLCSR